MSKYVDIDDPNFYQFINKKYSSYEIPKKQKTLKEICFPKKYEFQIPQKFLAEFINPKTPYSGILVYHRIGAGKTCTAINIAENFKKLKRIIIALPASLKGNFRSELRSQCAGNHYLTDEERNLLKKYDPSSLEYKDIINRSDARIDKYYTIYSYNKFVKLIKNHDIDLDNTLLIIDEIHNMISETGTYYETLHEFIHSSPDTNRLVLMSATPIFDKPVEIALTMNLILRDKQMPTGQEFIDTFMNIDYTFNGPVYSTKNLDLFKDYVRGYVSYYRGAPPHSFPQSLINFSKIRMSDLQLKIYNNTIRSDKNQNVRDYVNQDIPNSFFIGTRMISNIIYPNGKIAKTGFDSLAEHDLKISEIKEYSPKFLKILRRIKKCEGTVFVYSNFKEYGGIKPFARLLEHHNFKNYTDHGAGEKRFAILSGDTDINIKDEIRAVFNDKKNVDGSKIKVILGSSAIKEGISFLRVQQVHLIDPYWNMSRISQIIGRAIRFCSHKDVPREKQLVKVYIYLSVHSTIKMSVDQYMMKIALTKEKIKNDFEKALKEAAVDCELFKNANVFEGEDNLICID